MVKYSNNLANVPLQFFSTLNSRIVELRSTGADVIRLDIGSPDLPPPPEVIDTLARSAKHANYHGYQPHNGPRKLRQAWAGMYQRLHDIKLDINTEILPLLGSKEGIFHLTQALVNPGDVVLIPDPGYLTYAMSTKICGGEAYYLPLLEKNLFLPKLDEIPIRIARRAKILWLNYPNNPTSSTAPLEFFQEAVDYARTNNILLCHDAAYTQVTSDGNNQASIMEIPGAKDTVIEFNTLSKSHNMAGWRTGAAVGQRKALQALLTVKSNADSGHFLPIIDASIEAMEGDQRWIADRNAIYQQRRDLIVEELNQLGIKAHQVSASLYVWCPVPNGWRSRDFTNKILDEAHVSLVPGDVFGEHGEGFMRISIVQPIDVIEKAMARIKKIMPTMTPTTFEMAGGAAQ